MQRHGFDPCVGKILWRRKWQSALIFLLGKSHGQRSLAGYSPLVCRESDTTERRCACTYIHTHSYKEQNLVLIWSF